jgi:hypothetical protein
MVVEFSAAGIFMMPVTRCTSAANEPNDLNGVNEMKTLLATVAMLATLCTPTLAGSDMDTGVAYTILYAGKCEGGDELVSDKLKNFIVLYVKARNGAVQTEQKAIVAKLSNMGMDYATAVQLWCGLMAPKAEKLIGEMNHAAAKM